MSEPSPRPSEFPAPPPPQAPSSPPESSHTTANGADTRRDADSPTSQPLKHLRTAAERAQRLTAEFLSGETNPVADEAAISPSPTATASGIAFPLSHHPLTWSARFRGAWTFLTWWWEALSSEALTRMAAALTYRTIFSLIPLMVLGLVVLRMFANTEELVKSLVQRIVSFLGLGGIVAQGAAAGTETAGPQPSSAGDWVQDLVLKVTKIDFAAIGVVGLLALLYAGLGLLVELERSFNLVYNANRGRSWVRRAQQYWFTVSLGPLFLWASFWVERQFTTRVASLAEVGGLSISAESSSVLLDGLGYAATVMITWVLLFLIYISVPNTRVRVRPALIGALTAAILWEISKRLFTAYIAYSTGTVTLYGSLALVPLSLMWLYATWLILLSGLAVSYAIQHDALPRITGARGENADQALFVSPTVALDVATLVAAAFEKGKAASITGIMTTARLDERIVRSVLGRLTERDILRRISETGKPDAYTLARPAEKIAAAEVLEAGYELAPHHATGGAQERTLLENLRRAQVEHASTFTLAQLTDLAPAKLLSIQGGK
ncbi:MAG: YihY family inner membrane protein [Phycisphaerales bacterium]|nr:YihY family inner membrane protein [Phycisphaerales bacterium]